MATEPPRTAAPGASRWRRLTDSVRFRITALATLAVAVVLIVAGIALVTAQRRLLREDLEDTLQQRAADLLAMDEAPAGDPADDETFFQIVGPDAVVVAASANVAGLAPLEPPPEDEDDAARSTADLPFDDDAFLVVSIRGDDGRVAHTGAALDDVDEAAAALSRALWITVPAVVVLLGGVVWWLVGRTLRPVAAIRDEVDRIGAGALDRRVPVPASQDEIADLATTMNAMLGRVETATRRQQQFVADASHELRSPLTRVRAELEVDLAHPDRSDPAATHRSVLAETIALQRLVDDLLHLARHDAGALPARRDAVDLDDLVLREGDRLRASGDRRVDLHAVSAAQVIGDRDQLARAVRNVADNAARHASTTVTFALAEIDGTAVLTVADDGPGIPAPDRERVFERFARLDDARSAAAGGTGLGLAITREIVERHGGRVAIDPDWPVGTRLVIALPAGDLAGPGVTNGSPPSS
jgi:signal transduction histidine kinase